MTTTDRTERIDDPELVGSLMSAVRQLRDTQEELARQNAELRSLSSALEAERRRYQRLFELAPLAHLTTDLNGRIIEANTAAANMLLIGQQFLWGKPITAFVEPHERRRFRSWLLHPTDAPQQAFRMRRRGAVAFDAEVLVFPGLEDELAWIVRDVTDARRTERQMWDLNRDLEQRVEEQAGELAALYEQLPVGVAIVRADERASPRLNPRARQILDGTFPFDEQVESALLGQTVPAVHLQLDQAVLEVSGVPLRNPGGGISGAVLTFDDITERERIDRADREFVTNASHQLRTPIAAIGSAVAALKAGAAAVPKDRGRFLDHLEAETERLARIIEAMLVLSRAQRKELDAPLTLIRVRPLIERLVADTTPADGVELTLDCDETVGVIAHRALLEEALANLLANAAEHTKTGTIAVAARRRRDKVEIEIVDTGPGMEPAIRERAFERFFGSTPSRRSAGLGLAIAGAAVGASHGSIELDSEPGSGTRVLIRLFGAPLLPSEP